MAINRNEAVYLICFVRHIGLSMDLESDKNRIEEDILRGERAVYDKTSTKRFYRTEWLQLQSTMRIEHSS